MSGSIGRDWGQAGEPHHRAELHGLALALATAGR